MKKTISNTKIEIIPFVPQRRTVMDIYKDMLETAKDQQEFLEKNPNNEVALAIYREAYYWASQLELTEEINPTKI